MDLKAKNIFEQHSTPKNKMNPRSRKIITGHQMRPQRHSFVDLHISKNPTIYSSSQTRSTLSRDTSVATPTPRIVQFDRGTQVAIPQLNKSDEVAYLRNELRLCRDANNQL